MPTTIHVPEVEGWDYVKCEFTPVFPGGDIVIEHSLLSISKWEQITEKSFFDAKGLTGEEFALYVKCMTMNKVEPRIYDYMTKENVQEIETYMERPMTALKFPPEGRRPVKRLGEQTTSETIYFQMFTLNIDISCQKWHISRLMALIKYMSKENEKMYNGSKKPRKLTASEIAERDRVNEMRKRALRTKG